MAFCCVPHLMVYKELILVTDDCFSQVVRMTEQENPNPYDLRFLRSWLERPKMGNFPILGPDQHVWDKSNEKDLVAIRRRRGEDPFTRWFIDSCIPRFHSVFGKYFKVCTQINVPNQALKKNTRTICLKSPNPRYRNIRKHI